PGGTTFTNTATVTSDVDPNAENNTAIAETTSEVADIGVSNTAPPTGTAGSPISYTVIVTNNGPNTAGSATLTFPLPVTFTSFTQDTGLPAACSPGQTFICNFVGMANGASVQFTITGTIPSNTPNGTMLNGTATVSSGADPNGANNSATASTTV